MKIMYYGKSLLCSVFTKVAFGSTATMVSLQCLMPVTLNYTTQAGRITMTIYSDAGKV